MDSRVSTHLLTAKGRTLQAGPHANLLPRKDLMSDESGQTTILNEPQVAEADLSRRIEKAVQKDPLDRVRCVRVFDDFYRCNWWAQPVDDVTVRHAAAWSVFATQRVRKSRFLKATMAQGKLVIKDVL